MEYRIHINKLFYMFAKLIYEKNASFIAKHKQILERYNQNEVSNEKNTP